MLIENNLIKKNHLIKASGKDASLIGPKNEFYKVKK